MHDCARSAHDNPASFPAARVASISLGATNELVPSPTSDAAIGEINLLLMGIRQLRTDLVNGYLEKILVGNRPVPL